jgi:hypothetical protein
VSLSHQEVVATRPSTLYRSACASSLTNDSWSSGSLDMSVSTKIRDLSSDATTCGMASKEKAKAGKSKLGTMMPVHRGLSLGKL